MRDEARRVHPLRRYGTPEDMANLVNWLAGDEARYATGRLWVLDGGISAQVQQMRFRAGSGVVPRRPAPAGPAPRQRSPAVSSSASHRERQVEYDGTRAPRERWWPGQSDGILVRANEGCRLDKSQAFECSQVFVRGTRWISQGRHATAYSGRYGLGVGIETRGDERVGMLCRESVGSQAVNRKVPQVAGHDQVSSPFNRSGQHMDVVGVRKIESGGTCRVARHDRFGKVPVHYRPGSIQHVFREIGTVRQNAPHSLDVDARAPKGAHTGIGRRDAEESREGRPDRGCWRRATP